MSEPRFIRFESVGNERWRVVNKRAGDTLALVEWYAPWRCYTLVDAGFGAIFNGECLRDIASFMEDETRKRKAAK